MSACNGPPGAAGLPLERRRDAIERCERICRGGDRRPAVDDKACLGLERDVVRRSAASARIAPGAGGRES